MTALVAAVLESRTVLGNWLRLQVRQTSGQWFCQPGQFFLLRCGDSWSPYLRRPLFPTLGDSDNLTFLIPIGTDSSLDWLAGQPLGAPLDLVGPLGNGVSIHAQQRRLLLVGEGAATVSLLALIGPQLDRDASVGLLLQAESRTGLLPAAALPPAVEYFTACADPWPGQPESLAEQLGRSLAWCDSVVVAGSTSFTRFVKGQISETRFALPRGFAQGLAPVPLPCGIGACLACLVETGRGMRRACVRGPVFDLADLTL